MLHLILAAAASPMPAPRHLRVEGLEQAAAIISEPLPRFSFLHSLPSSARNTTQLSYRITVSERDGGRRLWDSGDVQSSACSQVVYGGVALAPFTRYEWTVRWRSSAGGTSAPATGRFETGLLAAADWQGDRKSVV